MIRRTLHLLALTPALLLTLAPAALAAQEGRVAFQRIVQYDFELPERWAGLRDEVPTAAVSDMVLLFNATESVTMPVPDAEEESGDRRGRRIAAMAARMRASSGSRRDQETLRASWASFADGSAVEQREFMGRTFLIEGERPAYGWKLAGEERQFLGYAVHKATAVQDGSTIEAWFAPGIPVPAGPGPYGGLPGLILVVSVDEGDIVYSATAIELGSFGDAAIAPPEGGDEVTRDEYERIVAEKLDEVRTLRGDGRRRPPF